MSIAFQIIIGKNLQQTEKLKENQFFYQIDFIYLVIFKNKLAQWLKI